MSVNHFQYNYQGSVPLGAKTIWPVYPEVFQNKFYESSWIFHTPKVGLLSQAIAKITLTSLGSNLTSESNIGPRIFNEIVFQTVRGPNDIQTLTGHYINLGMDNISTPNNQKILNGPDQPFDTSATFYIPLFFFFS